VCFIDTLRGAITEKQSESLAWNIRDNVIAR
jgi:hypothetical protein